jgi:LeuA allosteric (dimerisation) domain
MPDEPQPPAAATTTADAAIHLTRWTVTSGSNVQSRGAVVIAAGDHQWRASAEGNGAIDALFRAVDQALVEILSGHPRLVGYDIHALGEGADTVGVVTVRVAPPDASGARGTGEYLGEARGTNIIAASVEAYLIALNAMLAEAHWEGAPEAAARSGTRARKETPVAAGEARARRAELDEAAGEIDTTDWFNQ